MSILKIKKLTETAIIPTYAHSTDSGMDLYYDGESIELEPTAMVEVPTGNYIITEYERIPETEFVLVNAKRYLLSTGISIQLPPNTEAQIRPRSGLALKQGLTVLNSPGTVDEGYSGEIKVMIVNLGNDTAIITRGDRIGQMVIAPVIRCQITEVNMLGESDRGSEGFGSTGK